MRTLIGCALAILFASVSVAEVAVKVGIIGLDTSHALAFTKLLNATNPAPEYAGFRVVAAYPQGSRDIASSTNRVPGYIEIVKPQGVEIVGSIDELLKRCDVVLLESNDGRVHLEQALPVFKSGKRVFIDKPLAGSLPHAVALFDAAKKYNVPMFTSSSLRFTVKTQEIRSGKAGKVVGVEVLSSGDGSAFRAAGFQPGDVITAVDGKPITSAADAAALSGAIRAGTSVAVTVRRGDRQLPLAITLAP